MSRFELRQRWNRPAGFIQLAVTVDTGVEEIDMVAAMACVQRIVVAAAETLPGEDPHPERPGVAPSGGAA